MTPVLTGGLFNRIAFITDTGKTDSVGIPVTCCLLKKGKVKGKIRIPSKSTTPFVLGIHAFSNLVATSACFAEASAAVMSP